jgi:hypothetical protein
MAEERAFVATSLTVHSWHTADHEAGNFTLDCTSAYAFIAASRNAVIEICIASRLGIPRGWRFEIGIGGGFGTVTGGGFAV